MKITRTLTVPGIAVAAGVALLSAACTDPTMPGPPGGGARAHSTGATDAPTDSGDDLHSPLSEFLGVSGDESDMEQNRREQRYNELVVECMANQGFTYEPFPMDPDEAREAGPWSLPQEEFVARYGYGITTIDSADSGVSEDPNQERLDAMSAGERAAWMRALLGEDIPLDDEGRPTAEQTLEPSESVADPSPNAAELGCMGTSGRQIWGSDHGEGGSAGFDQLFQDMEQLRNRIDRDPRVVEAIRTWSGCMADAGHPGFDRPGDPEGAVTERLDELTRDTGDGGDGGDGDDLGREPTATQPAEDPFADVDAEKLQELRQYELALAAADHACSSDMQTIRQEVRVQHENDFIEQHRSDLEAYRDAIASTGGGVG